MTSFRRGMTIRQRQKARREILEKYLESARRQAAEARLTLRCKEAMALTGGDPAYVKALHLACRGEEPGNVGCLCHCHDVVTGRVETGTMSAM